MRTLILVAVAVVASLLVSCDQVVARKYGGTTTIDLPKGEKLLEVTWKDKNNLWYLTEPMDSCYTPKTKIFREKSVGGILEGKVIFRERR